MKYDDASWHYGGDLPPDLPREAGATHIAMFVAWAVLNGLAGDYHKVVCATELAKLLAREITPGAWFMQTCDEKFTDEDLSEDGNRFAVADYDSGSSYSLDYSNAFPNVPSLYHVDDSWTSFDTIAAVLAERLRAWRVKSQ
jgi:hypothetical protein